MSSLPVVSYSKFSIGDIKYSEPRLNANKGKTIYLNRADGGKILVQIPKMRAPFGLASYEDEGKPSTYRLILSVEDEGFKTFLNELDNAIVSKIAENSEYYLGKTMNETVIREALYTHVLKPSSDPKYAPGLNLKVLRNSDGSFVSPCYDTNRQPFDIEKLEKGQNVTAIINIASIWVIGTKFGVSVRLEQLRVTPSQKLASYAFIDDEEEVSAEFLSEDEM